jgi:phage portal protein BeeE
MEAKKQLSVDGMETRIVAWKRTIGDEEFDYGPEEIIYVWTPSFIEDGKPDFSPAEVSTISARVMHSSDDYTYAYFDRGTIQPTILTAPLETRDDEINKLERWWEELVSGNKNAWRAVGMRAEVDVKKLGDKPSDLAIDEFNMGAKANISAAYGIPDAMLSGKDVNYASGQAQRLNLIEHTIMPQCEFIAKEWNRQLFSRYDMRMVFQYQKLEIYRRLQEKRGVALLPLRNDGVMSTKELRVAIDMPPEIPPEMQDPEDEKELELLRSQLKAKNSQSDNGEVMEEVRRWKAKVARKGPDAAFSSKVIPPYIRTLIRMHIDEHPEDPFAWMDGHG